MAALAALAALVAPAKGAAQVGTNLDQGLDSLAVPAQPELPQLYSSLDTKFKGAQPPRIPEEVKATNGEQRAATETRSSLFAWGMTFFGACTSAIALGWYYLQVRARTTAASLPTAMLFMANDMVLFGTALATANQGIGTKVVCGLFLMCNAATFSHLWSREGADDSAKTSRRTLFSRFSVMDKFCMIACSVGIVSLVATKIPFLTPGISPAELLLGTAIVATAVKIVCSIPLYVSALAAPQPGEELAVKRGRIHTIGTTVMPLVLGTVGLASSLFTIEAYSLSTLMSPVGLTINNAALTIAFGIWAWRRSGDNTSDERISNRT
jgi:hypothetical protein